MGDGRQAMIPFGGHGRGPSRPWALATELINTKGTRANDERIWSIRARLDGRRSSATDLHTCGQRHPHCPLLVEFSQESRMSDESKESRVGPANPDGVKPHGDPLRHKVSESGAEASRAIRDEDGKGDA